LNHPADKDKSSPAEVDSATAESSADQGASRRRFTRNALIGGTVLLSLGNRAAWANAVPGECLSQETWTSYVTNNYTFASLQPGHGDRQMVADDILAAGTPPDTTTHPGFVCPKQ